LADRGSPTRTKAITEGKACRRISPERLLKVTIMASLKSYHKGSKHRGISRRLEGELARNRVEITRILLRKVTFYLALEEVEVVTEAVEEEITLLLK
jgi:hypothetical protein